MGMRYLMPGFGNYSLKLGEEDKRTVDGAVDHLGRTTEQQQIPFGDDYRKTNDKNSQRREQATTRTGNDETR
jgi:hypothetical protein